MFEFRPEGELPAVVRVDEKRLRQVLINVLGNAVKFTQGGSVTMRVRHAREMATFEIEDTGPGITEAEMQRIFEPFARLRRPACGRRGPGPDHQPDVRRCDGRTARGR